MAESVAPILSDPSVPLVNPQKGSQIVSLSTHYWKNQEKLFSFVRLHRDTDHTNVNLS